MSKQTTKRLSEKDANQVLQGVYNEAGTISVDGFVASKVGAKITRTEVDASTEDYRFFDIFSSNTVSVNSGSPTIQFSDELDQLVEEGQYVFGNDIPANTTINSFDRDTRTITMSANATGTNASESLKIANLLQRIRITYDSSAKANVDEVERLD